MSNREIKFRFWNGVKMQITDFHITCFGVAWMDSDDRNGSDEDRVLMQFTGLNDKNGVEIYEGDILLSHHNKSKTAIQFGAFQFTSQDDEKEHAIGFYFGKPIIPFGLDSNGDTDAYEVIGNIYEHPNLLAK